MGPLALLAIGAAMGLAKSELVDRPKEKRQRKLAAETQRLSPWTGLQAGQIQEADPFGSALSFGMTGASLGQNMQAAEANQKINDKLIERMDKGYYPNTQVQVASQPQYAMIPPQPYGMAPNYWGGVGTMGYGA